jgi:hypothetical protein
MKKFRKLPVVIEAAAKIPNGCFGEAPYEAELMLARRIAASILALKKEPI